jgi:hypothetical protein
MEDFNEMDEVNRLMQQFCTPSAFPEGSSSSSSNEDDDDYCTMAAVQFIKIAQVNAEYSRRHRGESTRRHRGSVPGHNVVPRNREEGYRRLYADYFAEFLVYGHTYFRRR